MEPERKIEKLLRTFAKKRRDQAGPPLELHAATRRLLQSEAARRATKPDRRNFLLNLLSRRPVWALGAGIAVAAVSVVLLVPSMTGTKSRQFAQQKVGSTESETADLKDSTSNVERPTSSIQLDTGVPVPRPAASPPASTAKERTPAFKRDQQERENFAANELADESKMKSEVGADQSQKTTAGPAREIAAETSTRSRPSAGPTLSADAIGRSEADSFGISTNLVATSGNKKFDEAGTLAGAVRFSDGSGALAKNQSGFYRVEQILLTNSADFVPAHIEASNASQVLATFAVEQNGRDLRIVDSDGSVYSGYLGLDSPAPGQPVDAAAREDARKVMQEPAAPVAGARVAQDQEARDTARRYNFQVSGSNSILKQNVVFSGSLVITNGMVISQGGFGGIGAGPGVPSLVLSNSRLSGTLSVEGQRLFRLNAEPVPAR